MLKQMSNMAISENNKQPETETTNCVLRDASRNKEIRAELKVAQLAKFSTISSVV